MNNADKLIEMWEEFVERWAETVEPTELPEEEPEELEFTEVQIELMEDFLDKLKSVPLADDDPDLDWIEDEDFNPEETS